MNEIADIQSFRQQGDLEAARRLLARHEAALFGYLMRMLRQREDAEDVLQDTFRKALAALPNFQGGKYFKSWLFRIGHNEAVNCLRKRNRRVAHFAAATEPNPDLSILGPRPRQPSLDGFEHLQRKERFQALHQAITCLPEAEREVVLLRLEAELPFREIAELTNAPLGTVLTRMHNAKQRLGASLRTLKEP